MLATQMVAGAQNGEDKEGKMYGPECALGVDDKEAAKGDALLLNENAVVARDGHGLVRDERQLEVWTKSALLARLSRPSKVGVMRVRRHTCKGR